MKRPDRILSILFSSFDILVRWQGIKEGFAGAGAASGISIHP
jgi:hypothetical protein